MNESTELRRDNSTIYWRSVDRRIISTDEMKVRLLIRGYDKRIILYEYTLEGFKTVYGD
jgi:hypothetical protein